MFEAFEHTADVGIRVRAADLGSLFSEAGRGLFSLIVENVDQVRAETSRALRLSAPLLEDLFFDWLAELLYLFDGERLVLCRFDATVDDTSLAAVVAGERVDPARHRLLHEVKSITYHGLSVRREGGGWTAEVIVDI